MLVDSHCHLNMLDLSLHDNELDQVIAAAAEHEVHHMLCISVDLPTFPEVLVIAERYSNIWATVGVHPNERMIDPLTEQQLITLADHPRVVGIGETGLDYFRNEGDMTWQQDQFRCHIAVAKQTVKPLIVHTRAARDDTIAVLREEAAEQAGGVLHCFTEDWAMAKQALDLGFYISFSGIVTFKNATELHEVAKKVPWDRMLIETDSPYLAPVPYRGKPNQPAYVRYVAERIAELRQTSWSKVADYTTENFFRLFQQAQRVAF